MTVSFDPAGNRIFVRFKGAWGITRGATSVAVKNIERALIPPPSAASSESRMRTAGAFDSSCRGPSQPAYSPVALRPGGNVMISFSTPVTPGMRSTSSWACFRVSSLSTAPLNDT